MLGISGIAADRYDRKSISIFSDMAMGMIAMIYAVLLSFFDLPVWTVFIMLCVRGIGSTFQQPAIQSIIPQLVPKDQLVKTNGWMQLLNSGSFLLGPVIGASVYFFYAPLSSFYPLMTSDHFDLSAMYGSAVEICFAVGVMVSSLLFSSVLKVEQKIRVSFIGLFGMGIASFICGAIPPVHIGWFFFAASCVCLGAAGNVHTIPLTAYIQETVAPEKIGVNVCFFISGLCMIVLTTLVLIQYAAKRRRKER